jgi:DeoR/GlpR family transcriptional regulator of sugar metabolism
VILDGGSTVASVAEHLATRSMRVITNSLAIVRLFHDSRNIDVTLTGGFLLPRLEIVLGPLCEQRLAAVAADVLVMGIGGATADGFSNNNTLVVGSERKMIEVAPRVIIVADSSKFGRPAMTPLAPLDVADTVVSDVNLADEHRGMLERAGIEVVLV